MALQSKLIFSMAMILLLISSCSENPSSSHHAMVIIDVTIEDSTALPKAQDIVNGLKKMHNNAEDEFKISFGYLDDLSGAAFKEKLLEAGDTNTATANPVKRKNEVKKFFEQFEGFLLEEMKGLNLSKAQSKIYMKICKSISLLNSSTAKEKYLIVYSDFLENSEFTSFYKDQELNKAQDNIEEFYNSKLKNACVLPDMSDIVVYMQVFRNPQTDVRVNKAEKFWIQLFKAQGANVRVDEF